MGKNYEAIHHIQEQLKEYDNDLSYAVQRLFNIEDQYKQNQGCVIDSIAAALLFKKYGIESEIHLGEMCPDGYQDAYHCWLTIDGKVLDIGIYGNSNYNPYYRGPKMTCPIILEDVGSVKYADGSTEESWLNQLSETAVLDYIKKCPENRICKLILKSLDMAENKENQDMIYDLAKDMYFPEVKHIDVSPSGRRGING